MNTAPNPDSPFSIPRPIPGAGSLSRIIPWAHKLLAEVLEPGDLAVDLTAGNGHDTLFLFNCVGPKGRVLTFDIQEGALDNTMLRLKGAGAEAVIRSGGPSPGEVPPGVHLITDSHSRLAGYLSAPPKAIIANLGYLPGGDRSLITRGDSTRAALERAFNALLPGGRIAVVVYPGHPGGAEEGRVVDGLFSGLPWEAWQVLRVDVANREEAPRLLAAEKRGV